MEINLLFELAAKSKASDIHLAVGLPPIVRVDGELLPISKLAPDWPDQPLTNNDLEVFMRGLLDKNQENRLIDKKDLDIGHQVGSYRYRVNLSFEKGRLRIVARIINEQIPSLEDIGMPPAVTDLLSVPQGFILITGPTGCGKSTTLAAMVEHINRQRRVNIVTLEDPIEYIFTNQQSIISQRQLGSDMISFASGLKHVLRQDPNVIMVGEMRDLETVAAALTLAETGHLVLATLHTYSAAQTVDRIIDLFPPYQQGQVKSQLAGVLTAVVSQRLLPKSGGGRIAAREIMINNDAVANLIREGKIANIKSALEIGGSFGMITLDKHLQQLYQAGLVDKNSALLHMEDPTFLDT